MTKKTAKQYLYDDIEVVIEDLNKNTLESEMPFVQAVLSARATISAEKLSKRMIWLTVVMTLATIILAITPFLLRYFESNQFEQVIEIQHERIEILQVKQKELKSKERNISESLVKLKQETILLKAALKGIESETSINKININKILKAIQPERKRLTN